MRQIIQNLSNGDTILENVPVPSVKYGEVLIKTSRSLVSLGTERMLVDFGKASLVAKARQQPERVKQVMEKIKTDGLKPTINSVLNKLSQPLPLGYCNVGRVVAIGDGVTDFSVGDRVASNGNHAEYVAVPKNLVVRIPENVTDEEATFTVIGSIGLQGIRLVNPTLGEAVVVVGLGLIGLITAQLLKANGCRVIGFDYDQHKVDIAHNLGIEAINPSVGVDQVQYVLDLTTAGADAVIITASSKSDDIISQAARMSRKRGRIILVGVVGLNINRSDFYEKELTFQVSCSYGPGRYDENYEQKGRDYPIGFVRWTEKRNFETVLNAISSGQLKVEHLITNRVPLTEYLSIYNDLNNPQIIASVIEYEEDEGQQTNIIKLSNRAFTNSKGVLGIIGAGNFTGAVILPALKKLSADVKTIASSKGLSSTLLAKKYDIPNSTTDQNTVLMDADIDLVIITTRHNSHASLVINSLNANKHVFVEKPLALTPKELSEIQGAYEKSNRTINVGYNRRFAPLALKMKSLLGDEKIPINIVATMNAGAIPNDSWLHDMNIGGGRIIGEACHFFDLCTYLTGSLIESVFMNAMGVCPQENTDNASILLKYKNGSNVVINYFSNGNKSYSKERIEVYSQGRNLILDNWRVLKGYGFKGFTKISSSQDKGHFNQFSSLIKSIKANGEPIIPPTQLFNSSEATFAAIESLKTNKWIEINKYVQNQ